ncbi:MAG: hypothetical protein ACQXXH_02615 [Candidatus Bathyarchaeia archaeon]|nr:hypothetical protein [Candidatus Bathyarchaeota archaeon A05DMB-4]MDH7594637.1 hypothetical protein [Candidatus Bathyarchaeota archaeon]
MPKKAIAGLVLSVIFLTAFIPYTLAHDLQSDNLSDYIKPYEQETLELAEAIGLKRARAALSLVAPFSTTLPNSIIFLGI